MANPDPCQGTTCAIRLPMLSRRHGPNRKDRQQTRATLMTITKSPPRKTGLPQSRFRSGPQRVCLHTVNTPSKGPKHGDITARGPPNQVKISLDHSAPSLSSLRSGVSHKQYPPNAISNSLRTNGSVSTMSCSRTLRDPLRTLTR